MTPYLGEHRLYSCPITKTEHDPLHTRHLLMIASSGRLWETLADRDDAVAELNEPGVDDGENVVARAEAKYSSATASLVQWARAAGFGIGEFTWAECIEAMQLFLEWLEQKKSSPAPSLTLFTPTTSAPSP